MPVKSMTGFGAAAVRDDCFRVSVELSSINRKQLDVSLRLPSQFAGAEPQLQKLISQQVSRGRIYGAFTVESSGGGDAEIDVKRAEEIVARLRRLAKKLKLADDLSAGALLQIPGLLKAPADAQNQEKVFPLFEKAMSAALKKLNAMRVEEGRALEEDFCARLITLESIRKKIEARAPSVASAYRKKLFDGLEKSGLKSFADDERVVKEIALFAERSDISEETVRLSSHIQQFKKLMRANEPSGRSLDFLAQEMFREINTIGSKANDLKITELVVMFKTELERVREQIQNVE